MRASATKSKSTAILDSAATYLRLDPTQLRGRLRALPEQCREAWQQSQEMHLPKSWRGIDRVVIGGMGGSAIAGDLVLDLTAQQSKTPVSVVRDFSFPFTLDPKTLFIACSHSGSTEETLSLFHEAQKQSAPTLAITGGGRLADEASTSGVPLLNINAPGEPRSAVGYNLMLLLGAFKTCGVLKLTGSAIDAAIATVETKISQLTEDVPFDVNPAKQIAQELSGKLAIVYGGGLFSGMARRWKTQLNENAKTWAFFEALPELLHNSVEAYRSPGAGVQNKMVLVLRPNTKAKDLQSRYRVVAQLLQANQVPHRVLEAGAISPLSQILSMLALGDYVSYYTAMLNGVDPSPIPVITQGKEFLQAE